MPDTPHHRLRSLRLFPQEEARLHAGLRVVLPLFAPDRHRSNQARTMRWTLLGWAWTIFSCSARAATKSDCALPSSFVMRAIKPSKNERLKRASSPKIGLSTWHLRRFLRQWRRALPPRTTAKNQRYPASQRDLWLELSRAFHATDGYRLFRQLPPTHALAASRCR